MNSENGRLLWIRLGFLLLSLMVFHETRGFALNPGYRMSQYIHRVWASDQGLPQNSVLAIVQTPDGYMWYGTQEGVARFDGVRFEVFNRKNTPELPSDYVEKLYVDRRGSLWIGTQRGLVEYYQGKWRLHKLEFETIIHFVTSIVEDSSGGLWVGTRDGLFHREEREWKRYHGDLGKNYVYALAAGRSQDLYVAMAKDVIRIHPEGQSKVPVAWGNSNNMPRAMLVDNGGLWIGMTSGLLYWTPQGQVIFTKQDGLAANLIWCIFLDRDGELWIGTENGLVRRRNKDWEAYTSENGLVGRAVYSVFEDQEGNLWVGTDVGGVNQFQNARVWSYSESEGLTNLPVWTVLETRDGRIIAGGRNSLFWKKGETWSVHPQAQNTIASITALHEDREGNIYFGTYGNGVYVINRGRRRKKLSPTVDLKNVTIAAIATTEGGRVWIGTDLGLYVFDRQVPSTLIKVKGLPEAVIRALHVDRLGKMWVGTDAGLFYCLPNSTQPHSIRGKLGQIPINSIYEDQRGILWIASSDGLFRWTDQQWNQISSNSGLPFTEIFQVLEDDQGYLWLSSNHGLIRVAKTDLDRWILGSRSPILWFRYTRDDGMRSTECLGGVQPSGWKSQDGKLWFPTLKGLVMVNPREPLDYPRPLAVRIESIKVDGQGTTFFSSPNKIQIYPPGRVNWEFQYTALSFVNPAKIQFRYRLDPYDRDWIDAYSARVAHYSHIPPGRFRFLVQATLTNREWKDSTAIEIIHKPYFYQTRFFVVLMGLAALGLAFGLYQIRLYELRKRERMLESLVEQRTLELRSANRSLELANRKLRRLTRIDGLTGVSNRRFFNEFLHREWRRSIRWQTPISMILIDVDNFKPFNDTYGHLAGDDCLKMIARTLADNVSRPTDLVARYGGDEFAIILSETDSSGALTVAERLQSRIKDLHLPHCKSSVKPYVTLSYGVASMKPQKGQDYTLLVSLADQALYQAKEKGRNQIVLQG